MVSKTLVPALALMMIIAGYSEISEAKRNRGGRSQASESTSSSTTAQDIRLRAKDELGNEAADDEEEAAEVEDTMPEFHIDYRIKKGQPRMQVRVQRFEEGEVFDVYIQNLKIATVTIDALGEGAADFRNGDWPAGLPMTLTAGMIARVVDAQGTVVLQGAFEAK